MNSFILISKNTQPQREYLKNFANSHHISPFDQTIITTEGSLGIEIIRKLQETIFLVPYQGKEKTLVFEHAEKLTQEAQNALLKLLEEPPMFLSIFLCAPSEDIFLPTVLSRCKVLKLETSSDHVILSESEESRLKNNLEQNLEILRSGSIPEKLALAEKLASDKENVGKWFEDMIIFAREKMLMCIDQKEQTQGNVYMLTLLQEAHKVFSTTNVSLRTLLEHYFLQNIIL